MHDRGSRTFHGRARRVASGGGVALLTLLAGCGTTGPDADPNVVTTVGVQPAQYTLYLGVSDVVQLNVVPLNSAGGVVSGRPPATWTSGAAAVASVSGGGVVTAVAVGTAVITATVDGVSGSAMITVAPPAVASVVANPGASVLIPGGTTTITVATLDAAGHELQGRTVAFTSSNLAAATVSAAGVVSAAGAGTTTITATSESKSAQVSVCVLPAVPNLSVQGVTMTQVVQRADNGIPLVAHGLPAAVAVQATSDIAFPAGCVPVTFRLIAMDDGVEVLRDETTASGNLPSVASPDVPSAYFTLPGYLIGPELTVLVEVDPHGAIPESNRADDTWPASGQGSALATVDVPTLQLRFVPIRLNAGGSVGSVDAGVMDEYLYATRQLYPVSSIDWDIGQELATNVAYGSGEQAAWVQILAELDMKRVVEASARYYVGALRPPPGVSFTQFGGFGYIPANPSSIGPGSRTNVLVGVGWFNRQRQTTELVAHELGHNHGRRHAPCGGAANPDPAYPYPGAQLGVTGIDMYTQSLSSGEPILLPASATFDVMGYCVPVWISDYNYAALLGWRLLAGPPAASTEPARSECDCLVVWGSIADDSIRVQPAFTTRTRVQLPERSGSYLVEGLRQDGSAAFQYAFEPFEIDHATGVRHFAFAIPASEADRSTLAAVRVSGGGRAALRTRSGARSVTSARLAADGTGLAPSPGGRAVLRWSADAFPAALVRDALTGDMLGVGTGGAFSVPARGGALDVILSDGVRSTTVRIVR